MSNAIKELSDNVAKLQSTAEKQVQTVQKSVKEQIGRIDKIEDAVRKFGAGSDKLFATARDAKAEGRYGFKSLSHFLLDVRQAATKQDPSRLTEHISKALSADPRFEKAATGMGEAVGPDGGFLLAPTFADGILEIMHADYNLLDNTDKFDIQGPSVKIKAFDETSRATGSRRGGVRGYWTDEGASGTASKPKFRNIELIPHKLFVLAYVTEELLADGGGILEQVVSRAAADEITFLTNDAIINGVGNGQPLGILNSACKVAVAKESGQTNTTVVSANILKMWSRLHVSSRKNAVWLINQDVEQQLNQMTLGTAGAAVAIYQPPGGLSAAPYATLLGRPVQVIEQCQTLGTEGDIILADLKAYVSATRGAINSAVSMHVQFLTDEMTYKFTFRVAGQPWWNSALTPFKGSNTQSPFITLAGRP